MAVDHVKSSYITNLDSKPSVANTAGEGSAGRLHSVEGSAVAVASSSADATYQLVRIPSNCKVKRIIWDGAAQTAGKFDLGLYYATDGENKAPTALLAAAAINQAFFAAVIDNASAVVARDVTNDGGTYTIDLRTQPIWQAVGLASDPGGCFDVVATVKTTAVTTGTGRFGISLIYAD